MTNPCVYQFDSNGRVLWETTPEGVRRRVVDLEATKALKNRGVLSNEEITEMLAKADLLETEYVRLRAKAVIALVKKFGKRRSEIARLERSDLQVANNDLEITFHLSKKHKKGLFQFMDY